MEIFAAAAKIYQIVNFREYRECKKALNRIAFKRNKYLLEFIIKYINLFVLKERKYFELIFVIRIDSRSKKERNERLCRNVLEVLKLNKVS